MFIQRKIPTVKCITTVAKADFEKQSANAIVEEYSVNACVEKGALCALPALTEIFDASGVAAAFKCALGLVYCTEKGVFLQNRQTRQISTVKFCKPNFLYCTKQGMLLISERGVGTFCFGTHWTQVFEKGFPLALCRERVFGVEGNRLYFTERDDCTLWNGEVQLPQSVFGLAERLDCLWAFGQEIFKIEFSDDTVNTKVLHMGGNTGNILGDTLRVLDRKFIFLAQNGLFCWHDGKMHQICREIDFAEDNSAAIAQVWAGKYWLSFVENDGKTALLCTDGTHCWRYDACATYIGEGLVVCVGGKMKTFCSDFANLFWKSKKFGFGNKFVQKHFRKMYVETKNDIDVHLVTERERRIYHIRGGTHRIALSGSFGAVSVEIYADCQTQVGHLALEVQSFGKEVDYAE